MKMSIPRCDADGINLLISDYLKKKSVEDEKPPWTVKKSPIGGYGIFATRNLKPNDLIYKDVPVIIGPRAALNSPLMCVNCFKNAHLKACSKGCGLPVCSNSCEKSASHKAECDLIRKWSKGRTSDEIDVKLFKSLTPVRSLFLNEAEKLLVLNLKSHRGVHHGFEVEVLKNELKFDIDEDDEKFMYMVCTILDANAFEVVTGDDVNQSSLRGLYPLGSLANHRCVPNTMHVFDKNQKMVVKASTNIKAGEELFHSYSRIIWGTTARRYHLKRTKHFWCSCPRCSDPKEFGTNMCAVFCQKCSDLVLPTNPLDLRTSWKCSCCKEIMKSTKVCMITSVLSSRVMSLKDDEVDEMLKFLEEKLTKVVPETNQIPIELKYRLIWIIGYKTPYTWSDVPEKYIVIKANFCRDLLKLLEMLGTGFCKMRGLLDYELFCCLRELRSRKNIQTNVQFDEEMNHLLQEAAVILKEDVSIPSELNEVYKEINNNNVVQNGEKTDNNIATTL